MTEHLLPIEDVERALDNAGVHRAATLHRATYKDCSTIVLIPTRGAIHHRVVSALMNLSPVMNQKRAVLFCTGAEVGDAYNTAVANILAHPDLGKWRYILCLEDDNIPPPDAHLKLLQAMHDLPDADGVGGLYFTKGDGGVPLALGDPKQFHKTGVVDFTPVDVRPALAAGERYLEVNGLPQGCTLFRTELFRYVPPPWFVTVSDSSGAFTQDLKFAHKAKKLGKRFFLDLHVRVGHLDVQTGIVY